MHFACQLCLIKNFDDNAGNFIPELRLFSIEIYIANFSQFKLIFRYFGNSLVPAQHFWFSHCEWKFTNPNSPRMNSSFLQAWKLHRKKTLNGLYVYWVTNFASFSRDHLQALWPSAKLHRNLNNRIKFEVKWFSPKMSNELRH